MNIWEEHKKSLGVVVNLYEVWKSKRGEELLIIMRAYDEHITVVKLLPKAPASENISIQELNVGYNSTSESIGNFLSRATKMYGSAERARELILQIERPGLNLTSKEAEMSAKKAVKGSKKVVSKEEKVAKTKKAPTTKVEEPVEVSSRSKISLLKIKVLNKDHGAREGTKRAAWLNALLSSKTVSEAQGKIEGIDSGVVRFAEQAGFISLS